VLGTVVVVPAVWVLAAAEPAAVVAELVSGAEAGPLAVQQALVLPLVVVSVAVARPVPVPVVGAVAARPVHSVGPVAPRVRVASPSVRSARSSTTCRRRR
jgi:hypothetical protein